MTKKAMKIAYNAHHEQFDKSGVPYIFHPYHLAEQMDDETSVIVALLHDVVEDTNWTLDELAEEGFSDEVIDALNLLTHNENIDYLEYVQQIKLSSNSYAKRVKLADLQHNSNSSRITNVDEKVLTNFEKYKKAISILIN
jgi:(p)ppGpp synthase/HD superfamily hydrolase